MTIEKKTQVEDWENCFSKLKKVQESKGTDQRVYFEQFIDAKELYYMKYQVRFHPYRKPE